MDIMELYEKKQELRKDLKMFINKRITQFVKESGVSVSDITVSLGYTWAIMDFIECNHKKAICACEVNFKLNV